jgi:glucarate dehydratase
MRIVDIEVTPVTVPMEAPLRWSMGVETGTTRGIIKVTTDEGIVGIGETYGGNAVEHAIEVAKPFILGLDPSRRASFSISWGFFVSGTKPPFLP